MRRQLRRLNPNFRDRRRLEELTATRRTERKQNFRRAAVCHQRTLLVRPESDAEIVRAGQTLSDEPSDQSPRTCVVILVNPRAIDDALDLQPPLATLPQPN